MGNLASDYRRQRAWRPWPEIFDALPPVAGRTILDLGCGPGDQAAELVARGARVIGLDTNEELLAAARSRGLAHAEFHRCDLRAPLEPGVTADGIWCSFTAAYFPDLTAALSSWSQHLRPGGWAALTEIDDLFGHEPLGARAKALFEAYAREALAAGRYDFHMGRRLADHLRRAGFTVTKTLTLEDAELSFTGPARAEVLDAWRARLDRMTLLRDFCGPDVELVHEALLDCLAHETHRSVASLRCCIANLDGPPRAE